MPEINPYEAPQSSGARPEQREPSLGEGLPAWIGTLIKAQFWCFLLAILLSQALEVFEALLILFGLLSVVALGVAIRYRIGWLLIIELIVIGLPLMLLFTVEFH